MDEKQPIFKDFSDNDETASDESGFTRLLRKIPGISSYIDKNDRREADQLLRNTIAERLSDARLQLSQVLTTLSKDIIKAIDFAAPIGRTDTRLVGLIGKIKAAPTGYTSWLAESKIAEPELNKIYAFDEQFFDHADLITASVAALQKAVKLDSDITAALSELDTAIENTQTAFDARNELLAGTAS